MEYFTNFFRKIIRSFEDLDQLSKMVFLSLSSGTIILGTFLVWQIVGQVENTNNEAEQAAQVAQTQITQNSLEVPTNSRPIVEKGVLGELRVSESEGQLVDGIAQIVGRPNSAPSYGDSNNPFGGSQPSPTPPPNQPNPANQPENTMGPQMENQNPVVPPENSNNNSNPEEKDKSKNDNTNDNTNSDPEKNFSFGVLGDTQEFDSKNDNGSLQKAVKNLSSANVEAVVAVGDLISKCDGDSSCETKYSEWKTVMSSLLSKTKAVMGNHDRVGKDDADQKWQTAFDFPTNGPTGFSETAYSFDVKNSHFVVLNSENPSEGLINKVQRDWLETDLSSSAKDNKFVFFHEPAYPVSSKIGESLDRNVSDRDELWSILKKHGVKAVFSGHEHIMSRKKIGGINQFVIGNTDTFDHNKPKAGKADYSYVGKHYAVVKISGKKVNVAIYSVEGSKIKDFDL